jgi:hypothetical protein
VLAEFEICVGRSRDARGRGPDSVQGLALTKQSRLVETENRIEIPKGEGNEVIWDTEESYKLKVSGNKSDLREVYLRKIWVRYSNFSTSESI